MATYTQIVYFSLLMKITIKILFLINFLLISTVIQAQKKGKDLVQFSGVVVAADSLRPIPFTNIIDKTIRHGTTTDYYGFFSFVAQLGDTIHFTSIGFKKAVYIIPDTLKSNRYSLIQVLTQDTILLSETVILPWPTQEQFKQAFLNLKIPDDDLERAKKNLARAELKDKMNTIAMDGSMNYRNYVSKQIYNYSYMGMQKPSLTGMMNNPLLNPFAWAQFIKSWKRGDFKRDD
ncbi:MAG: carboxypeptidase-like regulatory domain-containing protein [Saprospiraceae bacterium]|nr:carboxypeptidase-like regulatory domain-containing protein [Saprospiraceae bacterium]